MQCRGFTSKGRKCGQLATPGWTTCVTHKSQGVASGEPTKGEKAAERKRLAAEAKMAAFIRPIPATDPDANPLIAFSTEFRRVLARIRWYDEKLAEIRDERDLIWGLSKEEKINAAEYTGTNRTLEAKEHMWLVLQGRERDRLFNMEKLWLQVNLGAQQLELQKRVVASLDFAMQRVLSRLGLDPRDDVVRKVVHEELLQLERAREIDDEAQPA